MFVKESRIKPDGRQIHFYASKPFDMPHDMPSPDVQAAESTAHLRWHPLRMEWVAYASHRQNRTFLPKKSPLAVTTLGEEPTELPPGDYAIAVFENLFPTLSQHAPLPPVMEIPTAASKGVCEVVVFTQDPLTHLGALSIQHIALLLQVWADRSKAHAAAGCKYVLAFENRGAEVGVTLHHPHGQIYAYPFIPPIPAQEFAAQRQYTGGLLEDMITYELTGPRLLHARPEAIAWVPICARYPYEVWVAPQKAYGHLWQMPESAIMDLAATLKHVLTAYDRLWKKPFPYLMTLHEAPYDSEHPFDHLHIEFSPPYRSEGKLKFLAGTELGAGMFVNDSLPENKAQELREAMYG